MKIKFLQQRNVSFISRKSIKDLVALGDLLSQDQPQCAVHFTSRFIEIDLLSSCVRLPAPHYCESIFGKKVSLAIMNRVVPETPFCIFFKKGNYHAVQVSDYFAGNNRGPVRFFSVSFFGMEKDGIYGIGLKKMDIEKTL